MQAERCILAGHASRPDQVKILQSDCLRAYIQSDIGGTVKTFVSLPKSWWPPTWSQRFKDPVVELRRALYGHPMAGERWSAKISGALSELGFFKPEGWTSVFCKHAPSGITMVFVLYVDDLVMMGGPELEGTIAELRKAIKMEDPEPIKKYLGCHHVFEHEKSRHVAGYQFQMHDFMRQTCDIYTERTGLSL